MGGGKSEPITITQKEREAIIEELKGEMVDDNDYITVDEITDIVKCGTSNTIRNKILKAGFKLRKRAINGKQTNTLTTGEAKALIRGMQYE
jgi:hypothetical protein